MSKRRGLDGGSERVARIAGAGILMPGVDMRDLVKKMQAELDQLAPEGVVEDATEALLRHIAETVLAIGTAVHRVAYWATCGAEVIIAGPRIKWDGEVPHMVEFETQAVTRDSVFPSWKRDGEYIVPVVTLGRYIAEELYRSAEWRGRLTAFDRAAYKCGQARKKHLHMNMQVEDFLPLFCQAVDAFKALNVLTSSAAVSVELKGLEFWLDRHLGGSFAEYRREHGFGTEIPQEVIKSAKDQYVVPPTRSDIKTFIRGQDHPEREVSGGEVIRASEMSQKEARLFGDALRMYHKATM